MRYYYEPFKLKAWLRENQNLKLDRKFADGEISVKPDKLKQLEEGFEAASSSEKVNEWFNQLSRRERNASTYLLHQKHWSPQAIHSLQACLKNHAQEDHRLFKRMVDATYNTCDVDHLWDIVKLSFGSCSIRLKCP